MKKRLTVFAVLVLCLGIVQTASPIDILTYVGGQTIIDGNNTDGLGGGMKMAWGTPISDKLIGWIKYEGFKTQEALDFDNGLIALTYLTPDIVPKLRIGLYVNGEAGASKVETEETDWGFMGGAGFYFNLTDKLKLWVGGDYKDVAEGNRIYSASLGISSPISTK